MSYSILLFDIDDTLLDFHATENRALELLFEKHGIKLTDTVKDNYVKFNQSLWKKLELGEISRQELMTNRFTTFFKKEFNLNIDGLSLNREYLEFLSTGTDTIPGAKDLLFTLKKSGHKLYVVTNGIDFVQERRLRNTGFNSFFDDIFISQKIGYQKPDARFFKNVFNELSEFNPDDTLIIGDSLTSDIQGGHNANIDSIWYNPKSSPIDKKITPTYQVNKLQDILQIVG